jgi:hypothetical protein
MAQTKMGHTAWAWMELGPYRTFYSFFFFEKASVLVLYFGTE